MTTAITSSAIIHKWFIWSDFAVICCATQTKQLNEAERQNRRFSSVFIFLLCFIHRTNHVWCSTVTKDRVLIQSLNLREFQIEGTTRRVFIWNDVMKLRSPWRVRFIWFSFCVRKEINRSICFGFRAERRESAFVSRRTNVALVFLCEETKAKGTKVLTPFQTEVFLIELSVPFFRLLSDDYVVIEWSCLPLSLLRTTTGQQVSFLRSLGWHTSAVLRHSDVGARRCQA